jgi:hypothetical protein
MPCARAEDALPSAAIAALEMPSSAAAAAAA